MVTEVDLLPAVEHVRVKGEGHGASGRAVGFTGGEGSGRSEAGDRDGGASGQKRAAGHRGDQWELLCSDAAWVDLVDSRIVGQGRPTASR